ncbi:hypothetical protein KAJ83_07340 [Marivibrio halodurans]|uniref:Sulfotransferase family protein n=1 Tax=Marivibrio halodurans TaxID=2039722 RepID=A0A8J7RY02_9PROT|nr:hypothetical protein [Marivibrio halodurans]MBP5856817.1 hypothetical protein [Marivibrio halodurans]
MRPAVFIHIFKGGGTSASDWLLEHYPESSAPPDSTTFALAPDDYLDTPLLRGHIRFQDVMHLDRTMLTIIREPSAQTMSVLWHIASQAKEDREHRLLVDEISPESERGLVTVARELIETRGGMQAQYISPDSNEPERAPEAIPKFHAVGLTERLHDSLRLFAWNLGLPAPSVIPHARNSGAGDIEMPSKIREILDEHIRYDNRMYDAARERFDSDFSELCKAAGSERQIDAYLNYRAAPKFSKQALRQLIARKFT